MARSVAIPVDSFHHESVFLDVVDALADDHRQRDTVVATVALDGNLQRDPEDRAVINLTCKKRNMVN